MKQDYEKAFRGATPETLARALMQPVKRKPKPASKRKAHTNAAEERKAAAKDSAARKGWAVSSPG